MGSIQKPTRAVECPYEGCSENVLRDRNRGGRQHCPRCRGVFCFGCRVKWSKNHHEVCTFQDLVFFNAARKENSKCCTVCRLFVQSSPGCNRVTCRYQNRISKPFEELSLKQKHKRCEICFEEKLPVTSSIYKRETKCSELHSFCHDCMTTHILYRIQAKTAIIGCPGIECKATIDPVKCRSVIKRDSFVEWCDILAETWITDKGHRQAVCPYEGCSEVVIDECNDGGTQECPRCKRVFCFGCGVKWSRNHHQVCTFVFGEQIEQAFLDAARQGNWKRCPNCSFFIERRDGCNHMTCRCGTAFCYKCGVERCRTC